MLSKVNIGWVWLERTLNGIVDEINKQKPIGSASIAIEESPNGTLLKTVAQQQPGGSGIPNPPSGTAGWNQLAVIDDSTGVCVTKHIWYWGTPAA
jgi:hypothetical protein